MSFQEIIGHDAPIRLLRSALARDRVAHAYLFHGDDGIGKRLTARAMALAAACERSTDDACGACASCRWVSAGTHPDVREIGPTGKGRMIRIESIRELQTALTLKPVRSRYKVAILNNADRLNLESSNALLKTLEEPPDHSLILLVTSRPNHLLPTIHSRCLRVRFAPLPPTDLRRLLMLRRGVDNAEADRLLRLSSGRLDDALSADPDAMQEKLAEWVADLHGDSLRQTHRLLLTAEKFAADAATAQDFLVRLSAWLRDAALASSGKTDGLVHAAADQQVRQWAAAYDPAALVSLYRRTSRALALLERNANARLLIEDVLFALRDGRCIDLAAGRSGR